MKPIFTALTLSAAILLCANQSPAHPHHVRIELSDPEDDNTVITLFPDMAC